MAVEKRLLLAGSTAVLAAAPVQGTPGWQPVGNAERVVINVRVAGTTSFTWELWTMCSDDIASQVFIALDKTVTPSGLQTTLQGTNGDIYAFDTKGVDAVFLRPVTRTGGDEEITALATFYWNKP